MTTPLSDEKRFALEVLDIFDDLAKPEIKNRVFGKIWEFMKNYTFKIILKKPDNEITEKLLIIHKKLNSRFQDVNNSVEINKAEELGSVKIPKVGELYKIKKLTQINKNQAEELMKELSFD